MTNYSPLNIESVLFYAITDSEKRACEDSFENLVIDARRDFLINEDYAGLVIKTRLTNKRYYASVPKGLRRAIAFYIIDVENRCVIAKKDMHLSMKKEDRGRTLYVEFSRTMLNFKGCKTYKLLITDETSSTVLGENIFHTFDRNELGHPNEWYRMISGGLTVDKDENKTVFRSVNISPCEALNVKFFIENNLTSKYGLILPELEIRLYYPNGNYIHKEFIEPRRIDCAQNCVVELPFYSSALYEGVYYVEALCMQSPMAGFVFRTDSNEMKGEWTGLGYAPLEHYTQEAADQRFEKYLEIYGHDDTISHEIRSDYDRKYNDQSNTEVDVDIEECSDNSEDKTRCVSFRESMDRLTGLSKVKQKLLTYERIVKFNKLRTDRGLPVLSQPLHAMFLGSPGTGKTTVAKLMGEMLHKAGVLSKGHVVVRERATLLGQYYNSESEKTLEAIEAAQGGILLIDEAYQLFQPGDSKDPGRFVIETLLTTLSDNTKDDWMLILAGYPDEMLRMFDMNPGFKSRIPDSNIYTFDDFTESELMEIAMSYIERNRYTMTPAAKQALANRLSCDCQHRRKSFGNARHVINIILTEILPAMAMRITDSGIIDDDALTVIKAEDIRPSSNITELKQRKIGFHALEARA